MKSSVAVDPANGNITFGQYVVSLGSELSELPTSFSKTEEQAQVEGRVVPCTFASAAFQERDTNFELSLRYEKDRLVSATLAIEPRQFRDLQDDAFYESVDDRYDFHRSWLQTNQLPGKGYTATSWGAVGVARDKSENVFIFLQASKRS